MNISNRGVAQLPYQVIREKQFRMRTAPDKASIGFCDLSGNLDILDSNSLTRYARLSFSPFVGGEFFHDAIFWGGIEGNHPERVTGRVIHELRSLKFSASNWYSQVAVTSATTKVTVISTLNGSSRVVDGSNDIGGGSALAFSADGKYLALGDYACKCRVIDLEHMTEITVFTGHEERGEQGLFIQWIEFSPDGRFVASANEGLCFIWDARTGDIIGKGVGCMFVRFSPNADVVLFNDRSECFVWRLSSGEKRSYPWQGASIGAGDWSLSGLEIVTGDYKGRIQIRNVETGNVSNEYANIEESPVVDICWVGAGILALFGNGVVRLISG